MAEYLDVLRTEKKYPVSGIQVYQLVSILRQAFELDEYCQDGNGYLVRSIYFDSYNNQDFFEKESGLECRKKIRLRTYGTDSPVKLEWKQKQGSVQRKRSLVLKRKDAMALTEGDYNVLLEYDAPIAAEFYTLMVSKMYRPCCTVQYYRQAFVIPINKTRVTVDSGLSAHEGRFDLFSEAPPLYYTARAGNAILELKYNHFLPGYVKDILSPFGLTEVSSSKYMAARRYGLRGGQL